MRRVNLIAVAALWSAWAPGIHSETESWKIFVRASGTWTIAGGVEISSEGVLVTHEGENEQMPRCALLSQADVEYLGDRVAQIRQSISQREQSWPSTAMDNPIARVVIRWPGTEEFKRLQLPLGRHFVGGSPPLFVLELLERSWQLREAAGSPCRAGP